MALFTEKKKPASIADSSSLLVPVNQCRISVVEKALTGQCENLRF
jgi:hypothetical protein